MVHKYDRADFSFHITKCVGFLALVVLILSGFSTAGFAKASKENKKYASIVMDADTGMILSQESADKSLHPASLTKIMTLLMAFEAMEQGKIHRNTRIRISKHAASMVPSKLGLKPGSSIKVKNAINALVTKSANDVAVAFAEHLGRTERSFGNLMTRKARYIGMKNTTFRNASGLHDPKQVTTARDMALLAQYVINKYPQYYKYYNLKSFTYLGKTYKNHNKLLGTYSGMDGMKTGYIRASGFNLVASAKRNNQRIIGVVFGGRSGATRNSHMASLLDIGFKKIRNLRIADAKIPLPPRKPSSLIASNVNESRDTQLASMGALIGEGDYDVEKIRRIETGMMAISAHTGRQMKTIQPRQAVLKNPEPLNVLKEPTRMQYASISPEIDPNNSPNKQALMTTDNWSVQIGAFATRSATDELLHNSIKRLPSHSFKNVRSEVAPLKTQEGWLFRGRLAGLTRTQALAACGYFQECMPIAPDNR